MNERPPDFLFTRAGADWEATIEQADGTLVQVLVEDIDGEPNPQFVPKIRTILAELVSLESRARFGDPELASRLSVEHHLSLISETHPKADYALGFKGESETVIVDFKDGAVYSWCFLPDQVEVPALAR